MPDSRQCGFHVNPSEPRLRSIARFVGFHSVYEIGTITPEQFVQVVNVVWNRPKMHTQRLAAYHCPEVDCVECDGRQKEEDQEYSNRTIRHLPRANRGKSK